MFAFAEIRIRSWEPHKKFTLGYPHALAMKIISCELVISAKSDGTIVFAEITNSQDMIFIAKACGYPSVNFLWGSQLRILISANANIQNGSLSNRNCSC